MKAATLSQLKKELKNKTEEEKLQLILQLARFKKDNKELLTYCLFEAHDENGYRELLKESLHASLAQANQGHLYYVKKTIRKSLRNLKKQIRYSGQKETEAVMLIHFCATIQEFFPKEVSKSNQLQNMIAKQKELAMKAISSLHPDLQYDLKKEYALILQN